MVQYIPKDSDERTSILAQISLDLRKAKYEGSPF